ncbi:glycerophosphodiester phosphodiesterase [Streptomyces sp. LX-29]|uniref:glycerophosphodiester phosphodiesterase n=1 Tax=Streptomyces sp. LX-29 TaxID=2900152 RepID=UPI00240E1428|nr:glycerophosphodiester phosphodiesterase family protein [Streptomyces sp. LX-29]WFB06437.1 glycerophosphodiester phosphodiesterase [Streptomyces sp. LX-29]
MTFLTIGHRGVMGVEPENTLRSFARAEREGLDVLELDLHLSKDGALVVMHDADVRRTTDGSGRVGDLTLAELRELDAGRGERIPVFEEVVDAVGAPIQAEIKDRAAARALAEVLRRRALLDRVDVLSFHEEALAEIREALPGARTALVAEHYGLEVVDRAVAVGAGMLVLALPRITLELVQRARTAGLKVVGWTVNTPEELRLARALGLDGGTMDFPEIARAARFTA